MYIQPEAAYKIDEFTIAPAIENVFSDMVLENDKLLMTTSKRVRVVLVCFTIISNPIFEANLSPLSLSNWSLTATLSVTTNQLVDVEGNRYLIEQINLMLFLVFLHD